VLPVAGFVAVLTLVGGLAARNFYRQPSTSAPVVTAPRITTSLAPSSAGSLPSTVRITGDAAAFQLSGPTPLLTLLQSYFDSINNLNYEEWVSVVTTNLQQEHPEEQWRKSYHTSEDGNVVVYRVDEAPQGGLRVLLTFTSKQNSTDAPPSLPVGCINWQVVWSLTQEHGSWKIDTTTAGRTPQMEQC
jgi:hypothetical protein